MTVKAPHTHILKLHQEAVDSPLFTTTFSANLPAHTPWITQLQDIGQGCTDELASTLRHTRPDLSAPDVDVIIRGAIPKAVAFGPGLSAFDLPGRTTELTHLGNGIVKMYLIDQTADRGGALGEAAVRAVEAWGKPSVLIPPEQVAVRGLQAVMGWMEAHVAQAVHPDDALDAIDCFSEQVLRNEIRMRRLSEHFLSLPEAERPKFLEQNSDTLVDLMTTSAGFPSVSSGLYGIYRTEMPGLPSLQTVHANTRMRALLRTCNVAARIADEYSDWRTDAGENGAEWGIFTINPFNEYHPAMIAGFCKRAGITDTARQAELQAAFAAFSGASPAKKAALGELITTAFFDQAKTAVWQLEADPLHALQFGQYLTLCRRVLEICYVNMQGDLRLAAPKV